MNQEPKISLLPRVGTPEWDTEVTFYRNSTGAEKAERAKKLGYSHLSDYYRAMKRKGILLPNSLGVIGTYTPSEEEKQVLTILKNGPVNVTSLSEKLNVSESHIKNILQNLRNKNYEFNIYENDPSQLVSVPHTPTYIQDPISINLFKKKYKFGVVTDTHLGSVYQQISCLHKAYEIFDEREVDQIFHAGDVFDGFDMYRGHRDELFKYDAEQQKDYGVQNYPKSKKGIKTMMIGGQHDYCYVKQNGHNIVKALCTERSDLLYKGFFGAEIMISDAVPIVLQHPGGGTSYARSYRVQKIIENLMGYIMSVIRNKPEEYPNIPIMMLFGHWHIDVHLPSYMGIDAIALPCMQSQTKYLQQKGLMPVVGCTIIEIYLDEADRLSSTKVEFINMNSLIRKNDY